MAPAGTFLQSNFGNTLNPIFTQQQQGNMMKGNMMQQPGNMMQQQGNMMQQPGNMMQQQGNMMMMNPSHQNMMMQTQHPMMTNNIFFKQQQQQPFINQFSPTGFMTQQPMVIPQTTFLAQPQQTTFLAQPQQTTFVSQPIQQQQQQQYDPQQQQLTVTQPILETQNPVVEIEKQPVIEIEARKPVLEVSRVTTVPVVQTPIVDVQKTVTTLVQTPSVLTNTDEKTPTEIHHLILDQNKDLELLNKLVTHHIDQNRLIMEELRTLIRSRQIHDETEHRELQVVNPLVEQPNNVVVQRPVVEVQRVQVQPIQTSIVPNNIVKIDRQPLNLVQNQQNDIDQQIPRQTQQMQKTMQINDQQVPLIQTQTGTDTGFNFPRLQPFNNQNQMMQQQQTFNRFSSNQ